jgi:hypothetical protein
VSCEHLICAQCTGPVAEGRCSVCRSARADLHGHSLDLTGPAAAVTAVLILMLLVLALHLHV